jgi:hypothetical protein
LIIGTVLLIAVLADALGRGRKERIG